MLLNQHIRCWVAAAKAAFKATFKDTKGRNYYDGRHAWLCRKACDSSILLHFQHMLYLQHMNIPNKYFGLA